MNQTYTGGTHVMAKVDVDWQFFYVGRYSFKRINEQNNDEQVHDLYK